MNLKTYTVESEKTCPKLSSKRDDDFHMILGMTTECGELLDTFKKNLAYGKDIDWVNVKEEVGDIMWYIANFCRMNSINLEEVLDVNIRKLRIRYPEKFSREKALNRDLDKERKILEGEMIGPNETDIDYDTKTEFMSEEDENDLTLCEDFGFDWEE